MNIGEDNVEGVDHPRCPGNGERQDDEQQSGGDVPLLTTDAPPLLGRVKAHAQTVTADDGERQRVADGDDQHRNGVARADDGEEVREGRRVGGITRTALRSRWLVDDIGQRTDGGRTSSGRPQPST